jgi:hypothetical protein
VEKAQRTLDSFQMPVFSFQMTQVSFQIPVFSFQQALLASLRALKLPMTTEN